MLWFFPSCFLLKPIATSCLSPWHREPPRNLLHRSKAQLLHAGVGWLAALTKPCQRCSFSWEILASPPEWKHMKTVGNNGFMWMCFRLFMWKLMKTCIFIAPGKFNHSAGKLGSVVGFKWLKRNTYGTASMWVITQLRAMYEVSGISDRMLNCTFRKTTSWWIF